MVTTPWSENYPLQGIKFPCGGSFGVENGLNNLGWETWVYELGPLRGQVHSFHSSGWGWNLEPPAWDRRSLLMGSSRGGPSRRDIISGNHTLPGHRGAMRSSRTRSLRTLSRTPRSRAIGGNAYRWNLGHICTIASSPRGAWTSTDPGLNVSLRLLPSQWERHMSLASCDGMKLPTRDPGTETKVSSTLPRHVSIAAWPWSCKGGCPSGKTLWSWATTAGVSCKTVQNVSHWMLLP